MTVQRMGCDYTVSLFGGDAHVGAVALALPSAPSSALPGVLGVPGHREEALARHVAHTLAQVWQCRVCVVCGIHFDSITSEEIAQVLALADRLTHRVLQDPEQGNVEGL